MKFSFFHLMPYPHLPADFDEKYATPSLTFPNKHFDPKLGNQLYQRYLDELEYADQLGFDGIAVNEHHQSAYGLMPSPNIMAAALARRTERAKIMVLGNAIGIRGNPLRVAEEIAMLDHLSNGRVVSGFVRGIGWEYFGHSINPTRSRARFNEAHDLIIKAITAEMQARCPIAWSDTYGGHWVAAGNREVFELARSAEYLSNDHDVNNERRGYQGITIPTPEHMIQGGFLEMDPPGQRQYRQALNPYLSPAAVSRWVPVVRELVRACLDEKIETGQIDFVDDLANVVPAVLTLALMGIPLKHWTIYCEPAHAAVYTRPDSPDMARVRDRQIEMYQDMFAQLTTIKDNPRPGLIDALARAVINDRTPPDLELLGVMALIIGGGFDTTTALTAHTLEWLSEHPDQRDRLSQERDTLLDSATEEFLRFYTPAPGDGRTISADCEIAGTRFKEGERLWLSWAMANRDPSVFPNPNEVDLARTGNRHHSFGLGIHRCIGSNVARMVFKQMVTAVLDRMPDYRCDPAGAVHYETIGVIQGMRHLPATFTPGTRLGAGLDETIEAMQRACDEQRLAEPVTVRRASAEIVP